MAKRASCWFVISYYAGDRPGMKPKARGFVRGVMGKAAAQKYAAHEQKREGGGAANVIVKAFSCDRGTKLFDLKA